MATITTGIERWSNDVASQDAHINAAKRIELPYRPFPKQREFHASPAKYRLFGGAAGPGKSKALLMEAILQAHEHSGVNTLLLRRTFPELEQSLLLYFRRDVPRELYKNFQESKHVVTWHNGSTTRFGYCQRENDVYQYQGAEFLFIGIDELTLFTLRQWQFLTSRNRCPVPGAFPCMAGATNPGNIGHAWVKALWIDKSPAPGMENPAEYDPADYDFIAARVSDNPVYAADEHYLKTLRALPSHLKRAFLDGDWDVFAGQYFDNFDFSRHVTRAELIDFKPWWPRWISIDWGFEHPAAVYWHAAVPSGSSPVGAQQKGPPGRRLVEPGGSGAPGATFPSRDHRHDSPGENAWQDVNHPPRSSGLDGFVGAQSASTSGRTPGAAFSSRDHKHDSRMNAPAENTFDTSPSIVGVYADASVIPSEARNPSSAEPKRDPSGMMRPRDDDPRRIVIYREYVTHRTPPRELAREIIARSLCSAGVPPATLVVPHNAEDRRRDGGATTERIDAIYLSPDAFARRTDEASIAEQMGDIFAAAGLPRPIPADDDRVGGWMLMYQMLEAGEWVLTENCIELIRTLPNLVRDPARIEDIEKMDGDDPADAARYGLKSRYAAHRGDPNGWRSRMPLADRISAHAYSADPTIHAMQARKFTLEESRGAKPVKLSHRRR